MREQGFARTRGAESLLLFTILLLEGFITISVEILTIRQLLPFFGGSVVITSIIIGVFLLFLALGYWRGGCCKENYFKRLQRNFSASFFLIGIGLSYCLIALFFDFVMVFFAVPFLLGLFLYLLFFLAPIVYFLGQTVPLTTHLFNQELKTAQISGRALFFSTLGSFFGALLTSLIFFQYLGVAWALVINCSLLLCLIIFMQLKRGLPYWHVLGYLLALGCIINLNLNFERNFFKKTTNYANYRVVEDADFRRILEINGSSSSLVTNDQDAFPYIEFVRKLLFQQLHLQHKSILVVGAGGFTLTTKGSYENNVTYLDIDKNIKTLAEAHFLHRPIEGHFIAEDARRYLRENPKKYDVIFSDAYSHRMSIPPSLLTVDYFQLLARHLNKNGLMIVNIIANPFFQDNYARTVFNSIHAAFPYCTVVPIQWKKMANMMYVCPKTPQHDEWVYRDDRTTATMDYFKSLEAAR
jgi:spermidine synthase